MTNSEITKAFLLNTDTKTENLIVNNIAKHYGITSEEVYDEIYDEEAESLMDYITSEVRPVVSLLFNQFKKKYKEKH
jgi:ribosomal protein S24E